MRLLPARLLLLLLPLLLCPACGPPADPGEGDSTSNCAQQHARDWSIAAAPACPGGRTCLDERGRWWVSGEPFVPRGLYNAGFEYDRVLDNCPAGAACEATTPVDLEA